MNRLLLVMFVGLALWAQESEPHWIVGVKVGQSDFSDLNRCIDCEPDDVEDGSWDEKDTSFGLVAGYQINRYFSVETGWTHYGKLQERAEAGFEDEPTVGLKLTSIPVFAVGRFLFNEAFSVHAKAGYHFYKGSIDFGDVLDDFDVNFSQSGQDFIYGVGLAANLKHNLEISLDYERAEVPFKFEGEKYNTHLTEINLGLRYHF